MFLYKNKRFRISGKIFLITRWCEFTTIQYMRLVKWKIQEEISTHSNSNKIMVIQSYYIFFTETFAPFIDMALLSHESLRRGILMTYIIVIYSWYTHYTLNPRDFLSNSEALALELLENLEETVTRYHMDSLNNGMLALCIWPMTNYTHPYNVSSIQMAECTLSNYAMIIPTWYSISNHCPLRHNTRCFIISVYRK